MIEAIKKTILAGVGAAAITTERAEKALNEFVDKGKISAGEAKDAAKRLADDGKKEFEEASKGLESTIDGVLSKLGKGHSDRIEQLETKVADLEAKLAKFEENSVTVE